MNEDRKIANTLLDHWQLLFMLLVGAIACVKFYYTVQDLSNSQAKWQASTEQRRDKAREEIEAIRTRLTILETKINIGRSRE